MVEGLAAAARDTGTSVAALLGVSGPRAVVATVMAARCLAERRDAAVAAAGMVFPTVSLG